MHCVPVPSDLIGPNQAMAILGISRATFYRMVERGELVGYRVTSGLTRVSETEVRAHIKTTAPPSVEVDAYIKRIVEAAPKPTPEQAEKLRAWLASAPAQSEAA